MIIKDFIAAFPLADQRNMLPWEVTKMLCETVSVMIAGLPKDYVISDAVAIHKSATVENGVTLKSPLIIGPNCFIGANAYLRGGVFLATGVVVGPGCEIKTSIICDNSVLAHFNFIGDSIVGSNVNFEAGSVTANHHNDRVNKRIYIVDDLIVVDTGTDKFGSLVGDNCKIGANAVLSPGTILKPNTIVKRLALIDQSQNH